MEWIDFIRDLLYRMTPYLPGIVGFLIAMSFVLIGALVFVVRKIRKAPKDADSKDDAGRRLKEDRDYEPFSAEPEDLPLLPMKKSFKHALKILRNHVSGRDWRYAIPWYLLIGPEQSGKSTLVAHTGMDLPIGHPADDFEDIRPACKWWFFDRGIVLDMAGSLIRQRDGRGSNVRSWRNFLGFLDHYRPRRPADGIILAVPIEDFLDDDGAVRPPEDIVQRADAVYKKLWQAQSRLGLAFPVYVVITKLDRLPGFQALVSELPDHALADMLGWSSPYSFETEFRDSWVDETVEAVGRSLQAAQMEIFATTGDAAAAEEIYRLPASFEGLREPMRLYLGQLFKPSVFHDSFSPRGIWFTGDSGMEDTVAHRPVAALSGIYGGPRARAAYPVFLRDLFETKIFPERNMARPVKRALLARNKVATGAQAASAAVVLFGGLALWLLYGHMQREVHSVTPFIETVGKNLQEVEAANRANTGQGRAGSFNRERALHLLEGMADLEVGSFFSILIPSSWVADVDSRVVYITTEAFSNFILQSMGAALDERGQSIGLGRLPPRYSDPGAADLEATLTGGDLPEGAVPVLAPPQRGADFDLLRQYVRAVRDFEAAINRYNQLRDTRDLEDVRRLVSYLFQVRLPESFLEHSDFYTQALSGSSYRPIPLDAYARNMRGQYEGRMNAALTSLYGGNSLVLALRDLAQRMDEAGASRTAGLTELQDLRQRIEGVSEMLKNPRFDWMDDPTFDPTSAYADLTERIGGSYILGQDEAAAFNRAHQQGLTQLNQDLPDIRAVSVGPMLAREGDRVVLALSPAVVEFHAVLQAFYQQPFMREGRLQPLPSAASVGTAIEWDAAALEDGLDLVDDYEGFLRNELDRVPRSMASLLRTAGGQSLERHVNDRIANAMLVPRGRSSAIVQTEDQLRRAVTSFANAGAVLRQILAAYDDLGLEDSYLELLDLSTGSAFAMIEQADSLFSASSLYIPQGGDFSWWRGEAGLALDAFRARDSFSLLDVLGQQRGRINIIAMNYVKPVADFLNALETNLSDRERALLGKWTQIIDELTKYELQQADNTVSELERFITGPMMDVGFANCAETLGESVQRGSSDFFLDRINRLSRGIQSRCLELAGVEAQTAYSAIADSFDDFLSGRYPFTLPPFESDMREVSPRELQAFFARYDREVPSARRALEQAEDMGLSRDRALQFIARMDRIRALFDPWMTGAAAQDSPVFTLDIAFRVNRGREVGGDQVIDWQISSGPETVSLRGENKVLRWALGEPISIVLRWAENSTLVPAVAVDQPNVRVDGRRVEIVYDNLWSLMDLIRRHQAGSEDFAEFVDTRPHTLRIDLPTRPADGGAIEMAKLFLRVEVTALKDGQAVPLLVTPFPYEAPQLEP